MRLKYGHEWDENASDKSIELACFRDNITPEMGGLGAEQHYINWIESMWPETMSDGKPGIALHKWERRRIKALCDPRPEYRFMTWWGPSAAGKSTSGAAYALTQFLAAPDETCIVIVSTTLKALSKRIWAEIHRLYMPYDGQLPCRIVPSEYKIQYVDPATGKPSPRFGIFCIGIQNATLKDAIGDLIGVHPPRMILIIDEMQSTKEAAVGAIPNLSTARFFQFLGMGNPSSLFDCLVLYSEPLMGWKKWREHDPQRRITEWQTKYGVCLWFDGHDSPAITEEDGDEQYSYLLRQRHLDEATRWWGAQSPQYWSQRRGYVPPEGVADTVMTEFFVDDHSMRADVQWEEGYEDFGSLDPSFSTGGDRCMFSHFRVGKIHGAPVIHFLPYIQIKIEPQIGESIPTFIARKLRELCKERNITRSRLGIDCTGSGFALADVVNMDPEWKDDGQRVHRTYFTGKAPAIPVAVDDPRMCNDVFYNQVTYLWYMMYHFGRFGQIRGLGVDDCKEFCSREVIRQKPLQVMPKEDMEGRSPDIADSRAVGLDILRRVRGIVPGWDVEKTHEPESKRNQQQVLEEIMAVDNDPEAYLHDEI